MSLGKCRSCSAPVIWMKTKYGKMNPVNPPAEGFVINEGDIFDPKIHRSHFIDCPNAANHRREAVRVKCRTTHSACKKRLKKEGGSARCCFCFPHDNCNLNPDPVEGPDLLQGT